MNEEIKFNHNAPTAQMSDGNISWLEQNGVKFTYSERNPAGRYVPEPQLLDTASVATQKVLPMLADIVKKLDKMAQLVAVAMIIVQDTVKDETPKPAEPEPETPTDLPAGEPILCPYCGHAPFKTESALKTHITKSHSEVKDDAKQDTDGNTGTDL